MIEFIKPYDNSQKDIAFDNSLLNSLPTPIAEILSLIENEKEPQIRLQHLCLSLIPTLFQYLALILSSEYLFSNDPPEIDVTDSLWSMIRMHSSGKWVNFIRTVTICIIEIHQQSQKKLLSLYT